MRSFPLLTLALVCLATVVWGHAAMIIPTTRNAMDRNLPAFSGGKSGSCPCTCADATACDMGDARREGGGGQPCLWWSQGCSIGCPYCLTDPRHPLNNHTIPTKPITGSAPHADKAGFRTSYCEKPTTASVLPKEFWTLNTEAQEGAEDDSYRFNPWRAPGTAPVVDPCGQAGGKYTQTPMGGDSVFAAVDVNGTKLQMGDLGSQVLPQTDPKDVPDWVVGSTPRVAWGMRFNHGGGYQYRLCPLEKMPCSEADFQEMPLDFVRDAQAIMWNNGTLYPIKGMFVDGSVVVPKGSTWARNPVPRIHTDNVGMAYVGKCLQGAACSQAGAPYCPAKDDCQQFPSPCSIDDGWFNGNATHMPTGSFPPDSNNHEGWCSGDWTLGMISDQVVIPATINPGKYVVSWRWDCEETAQVWQNCADVNIVAA
eukprot:TRINITY_DN517_c0_g1_i2.p1 TRINITY_DN517_c0_g1~~TRINITY_DN517_c0_g1_i2.p1  ORF type:complete len:424 (-),score=67.35 TRINITY_DN517_c0_g1_i2:222-1493(-)